MKLLKIMLKRQTRKLLHANIDVNSRRLIAAFPKDGIKCIKKLQSYCANMTFGKKKVDMTGPLNKSHIKEGNLQSTTSRGYKIHMLYQFQ